MNYENLLKKFLKKKIKFTQSLLVVFLITGGITQASSETAEIVISYLKEKPILTENFAIDSISVANEDDPNVFAITLRDTKLAENGTNLDYITTDTLYFQVNDATGIATSLGTSNQDIGKLPTEINSTFYNLTGNVLSAGATSDGNTTIKGNFIANKGGLPVKIYKGKVKEVIANFIGNASNQSGGAISVGDQTSSIETITGNFIGNTSTLHAGAIFNVGKINSITGNFITNASGVEGSLYTSGGAISNRGTIGAITGEFINNRSNKAGGAIDSSGGIESITGIFIDNESGYAGGGAISNTGNLGTVTGEFQNNSTTTNGGAINNTGNLGAITGSFTGNESTGDGGAINNTGNITITGNTNFEGNIANGESNALNNGNIVDADGNVIGSGSTVLAPVGDDEIIFNDKITGTPESNLAIGGIVNLPTSSDGNGNYLDKNGDIAFTTSTDITGAPTIEDVIIKESLVGTNGDNSYFVDDNGNIYDKDGNKVSTPSYSVNTDGTVDLNADMSDFLGDVAIAGGTIEIGPNVGKDENGDTNFFGGNVSVEDDFNLDMNNGVNDNINTENWETVAKPDGTKPTINTGIDVDMATGTNDSFTNVDGENIVVDNIIVQNPVPDQELDITVATPKPGATNGGIGNVSIGTTTATGSDGVFDYEFIIDPDKFVDGKLQIDGAAPNQVATAALDGTVAAAAYASNIMNITDRILNKERNHNFSNSVWVDISSSEETVEYTTAIKNEEFDNKVNILTAGFDYKSNTILGIDNISSIYFGQLKSTQEFRDQELKQEGFFLGYGLEVSKGNKFANFTLNGAKLDAENKNNKSEKFDITSFSVASKFGVELGYEFATITPSVVLGYHNIKTDGYKNINGLPISSSSTNVLNIKPEIRISKEILGYETYAVLGYSFNSYDGGDVKIAKKTLPVGEVESYSEARLGLNKEFFQNTLETYAEIIKTAGDKDSFGAQIGFEYKF